MWLGVFNIKYAVLIILFHFLTKAIVEGILKNITEVMAFVSSPELKTQVRYLYLSGHISKKDISNVSRPIVIKFQGAE